MEGCMTTENGAFSTASLELVKRELGGIREFYESADELGDTAAARGSGAHRLAAGQAAGRAAAG